MNNLSTTAKTSTPKQIPGWMVKIVANTAHLNQAPRQPHKVVPAKQGGTDVGIMMKGCGTIWRD